VERLGAAAAEELRAVCVKTFTSYMDSHIAQRLFRLTTGYTRYIEISEDTRISTSGVNGCLQRKPCTEYTFTSAAMHTVRSSTLLGNGLNYVANIVEPDCWQYSPVHIHVCGVNSQCDSITSRVALEIRNHDVSREIQ